VEARHVVRRLLRDPQFTREASPSRLELIRELAALEIAVPGDDEIRPLSATLIVVRAPELRAPWKIAFLDGLTEGLRRHPAGTRFGMGDSELIRQLEEGAELPLLTSLWRLARALGMPETAAQRWGQSKALRDAVDPGLSVESRLEAIQILGLGEFSETGSALFSLLDSGQASRIQEAAFEILRDHKEPEVARGLIGAWRSLAPALRPAVVNLLVYRPAFQDALLTALEQGKLNVGELNLDLEHRRELLRKADEGIRQRAAAFMSDEEYSNRKSIVDDWLGKLPESGDAARGRPVFERICAQCHRSHGEGNLVGPELTGLNHRSVEDLVSNILDPNMAMNPAYVSFAVELSDGESETGILQQNSAASVTLLQALGRKVEIPRSQIRRLESEGRSLMPEGLESGMNPQELRDLVAFIQESPTEASAIPRKP
jgi:putative heme-binding domain-containing protein